MKSIITQFALLYLVFYNVDALPQCAELNKPGTILRAPEIDTGVLSLQNELEDIFDAFHNGDTEHMEELFKILENRTISEPEYAPTPTDYAGKVIKYVVNSDEHFLFHFKNTYLFYVLKKILNFSLNSIARSN